MIIPIRCFSCGKPIGHLWEQYQQHVDAGEAPGEVMDKLNIKRYCCRSVFLGNVDLIDTIAEFKKF
jgi:DNA-directed RNA polymerase subunit N